ncbi:UNKNOWN [Stylonychia lemnae]|uniref:Uncharacterized protein n=1 Tax=Stylonychia lemnae TaxID=5949 RepID=A0A078A6F4_STYLE|nr:UNKNOWN [Stylonychia lemnae]|eukprot:CDW77451.1 UNKNOWN [Stylonychia lemnae]
MIMQNADNNSTCSTRSLTRKISNIKIKKQNDYSSNFFEEFDSSSNPSPQPIKNPLIVAQQAFKKHFQKDYDPLGAINSFQINNRRKLVAQMCPIKVEKF